MSQTSPILRALSAVTVIGALSATGYIIYFDYQRRNNAQFRKNLKTNLKKQQKETKLKEEKEAKENLSKVSTFLIEELKKNPIDPTPSKREEIFTSSLEEGELLATKAKNENDQLLAASKFYRALSVYPNPSELLEIYQKTLPSSVYNFVVLMIAILPPSNVSSFLNGLGEKMNDLKNQAETLAEINDIDG
ncbi:TOM complex receptor protein TOM20 NDAI_0G01420 [Naumovozyma dairenensis CBS 421]|uniref:Mitochondrial import receptor subunit TOM20 n=1 Tax=Naumovozyma dairenensis (strain ATCC 10597 / BCRC 20456 / CBS 421 / NBRC 0211 / NRRL Y-12639) TaxID=1071378 RepID=G0WDQ7_NAUDC|nr:hypothetical protein NDAI_0G01420 [Naumovozyma dairenensis CBS 421]CCD25918.2 hypothetical protein NDAI_0G01420 [Naumovozyma dairenensis CBS 421]